MEDDIRDQQEPQELYEHYRFTVDKGQAPLRIDKFLFTKIQNASRTKIQAAADAGNILVNDKPVKSNYKIKGNDIITILLTFPPRDKEIYPENIPLDIIYEDDDLLMVNKPAGMVVHPAYNNYTGTLVNALYWHFKDLPLFQKGDLRPGLVHRIDKNTSGLLVIAKTEPALNLLARQFFEHTIDRRYIALVWGNLEQDSGTINGHIGRSQRDRKIMDVYPNGEIGKPAISHYKVLERFNYVTLIECKLETGRTHQIRAHFRHLGHPLFNDEEYGGNRIIKGTTFSKYKQFIDNCFELCPRQALHAQSLEFIHPSTHKLVSFTSELPEDMKALLTKWRNYVQAIKLDT